MRGGRWVGRALGIGGSGVSKHGSRVGQRGGDCVRGGDIGRISSGAGGRWSESGGVIGVGRGGGIVRAGGRCGRVHGGGLTRWWR